MKTSYYKYKLVDTLPIKKIITIHYLELDKTFQSKGEQHDFWEFVYVDKGTAIAKTGENTITLKAGDCIFHEPNEYHIHMSDENDIPNIFIISFVCLASGMEFFRHFHGSVPHKFRYLITNIFSEGKATFSLPVNNPYFAKLESREDAILGGEQMIRTYLEQLLILLMRTANSTSSPTVFATKESMESHIAGKIAEYLEQNLYKHNVSAEELCQLIGYSRAYLSKIFKSTYNCTITEYETNLKIKEAKHLIREQTLNFSQISEKLCFPNPFYFSRVFKKNVGMSPTEYQRSIRSD